MKNRTSLQALMLILSVMLILPAWSEPLAAPYLEVLDATNVTEGNSGLTNASFTVRLVGLATQTVTVSYKTVGGTAHTGSDYLSQTGLLSFAPGETTKIVTVPVNGDTTDEGNEIFYLSIYSAINATIADSKGQVTILDDDNVPAISINDIAIAEGKTGVTSYAGFQVTLSNASAYTVTVKYQTTSGTATPANKDYVSKPLTLLTFLPGVVSQTVKVAVIGDNTNEADETFYLDLSAPINATIADNRGDGTIANDDTNLTIDNITVAEGDPVRGEAGRALANFTVTRSGITTRTTTVKYATVNGTAIAGKDYLAATGIVVFDPSVTTQTITVQIYSDLAYEPDESFYVNLSSATNATISDTQGVGTITDSDTKPTIAISDPTVVEDTGVTRYAYFQAALSRPSSQTVTVKYATANGTATVTSDYGAKSGTLTFAPGVTSLAIAVAVVGDNLVEADETFVINLSIAVNATIADAQGSCTIQDNDTNLTIANVSVTEGNPVRSDKARAIAVFTVTRTGVTSATSTVKYATANGTAIAGPDYQATSGILSFGPGVTSQTISVVVIGDNFWEQDETFYVKLSSATQATIADAQAIGTITNDDAQPTISISDVTVQEGTGATVYANFIVSLTGATSVTATVKYATANGTAAATLDYTAKSGTLSFAPGVIKQMLTVAIAGDTLAEGDETFTVNLTNAVNATISDAQGSCTIQDNDINLNIDEVAVVEGNTGSVNAVFTVTRSGINTATSTVQYQTANGTAVAPGDYQSKSGILTFGPGVTTQNITIVVYGDTIRELPDETFFVNLSNATNALIKDGQGKGIITNDDPVPDITINDVTVVEPNSGYTYARFLVSLSTASTEKVTVKYTTTNGSAIAPGDYTSKLGTLTFNPGVTILQLAIVVRGDTTVEPNETFTVDLSNATNGVISDAQGVCTIIKTRHDYNGDGQADLALWHQTPAAWQVLSSAPQLPNQERVWGNTGEFIPVAGDYDGDGLYDMGLWEKTTGQWYCQSLDDRHGWRLYKQWQIAQPGASFMPVPADYDGDGKTDLALYNAATGQWHCLRSSEYNNSCSYKTWGQPGQLPVPADYDGDGLADVAVWTPTTGEWYVLKSSDHYNSCIYKTWGNLVGCVPVPADYDGDGKADFAVWNPATGEWFALNSHDQYATSQYHTWGKLAGDSFVPVPADYDGDGKSDFAVYDKTTGNLYSLLSGGENATHLQKAWHVAGWESALAVTDGQHVTCKLDLSLPTKRRQVASDHHELPVILENTELSPVSPGIFGNAEIARNLPGTLGMEMAPPSLPCNLGHEEWPAQK